MFGNAVIANAIIYRLVHHCEIVKIISWAELYDNADFEKKKMIMNCLIRRVDVCRDYKLKIDFNFDFQQFISGIDSVA